MTHLTQEQLYTYVLDAERLAAADMEHLESCAQCQAEVQSISRLAHALRVARASDLSPAALTAYQAIFQEHGPARRGALARAWNWATANLVSDSRVQPLRAATRSVQANSYRLLYDSPLADVELFVEGEGRARRLQGDVIAVEPEQEVLQAETAAGDTLVQLQAQQNLNVLFETYTDQEGRFLFDAVPLGEYRLFVTGPADTMLEISELKIT